MAFSAPSKLTLISHGMTQAMREARFPNDEPLIDNFTQISLPRADFVFTAPEIRTRQTAGDRPAEVDENLRDLDCGRFAGLKFDEVDEADLVSWLTDPYSAPHGGESVAQLCDRAATWLEECSRRSGRVVAVTHPAVIRAVIVTALQTPLNMFWRIDVGPLSRTRFRYRNGWTMTIGESGQRD